MMIYYADGQEESSQNRFSRILTVLECPKCSGSLLQLLNVLICNSCDCKYPVRAFVPILLPSGVADLGAATNSENDPISRHPYSVSASNIIAAHKDGLVLDLGAGGKLDRYANVVQIDIFRYPAVDVVASADRLPFADNTFDAVVSQAVFEHLQYPEWAAAEIRRVLKVGGVAKIDTAFLQPEHGYPHHFFNATESGLRHWFRDFDITWSGVEPFQQPKWALHWFLGVYLDYIGPVHAAVLGKMYVSELAEILQRHASGKTENSDLQAIEALDSLPARFQRVLAAGVSVHAVNRAKPSGPRAFSNDVALASVDREREMELLRAEQLLIHAENQSTNERLQVVRLKGDYLCQFSPGLNQSIVTITDVVGPKARYLDTLTAAPHCVAERTRPFATFVINPSSASSLLDTFFSLVSQTFSGWELLVILGKDEQATLSGIASRLTKLDARVKVHMRELAQNITELFKGEYCLNLIDGATLMVRALEEVVTAARFTSGIDGVSFDYVRSSNDGLQTVTCHAQGLWGAEQDYVESHVCFFKVAVSDVVRVGALQFAHLPIPLMRLPNDIERISAKLKVRSRYLIEQNMLQSIDLTELKLDSESLAGELRKLSDDIANYLSQFYPETRNSSELQLGTWLRRSLSRGLKNYLPFKWWQVVQKISQRGRGFPQVHVNSKTEFPFATFLLEPKSAIGLIRTFFSLVHQSHTGWQLVLIENHDQSPAVRRAIFDFKALEQRITVVNGSDYRIKNELIKAQACGKYTLLLTDDVTLRFSCVEQVVALVRDNDGLDEVVCDYQLSDDSAMAPMRCYNSNVADGFSASDTAMFDGTFYNREFGHKPKNSDRNIAYLPKVLFHVLRKAT